MSEPLPEWLCRYRCLCRHNLSGSANIVIPEAVELVLHAAALAEAGAVYVLEMGDQVKLVDMACNLIPLSGFVPDVEIPIVFTGLRPGEKLFEELVGDDERLEPSSVEKILRVRPGTPARLDQLSVQIAELERLAVDGDIPGTLRQLACIVPAFQPGSSPASATTAGLKTCATPVTSTGSAGL